MKPRNPSVASGIIYKRIVSHQGLKYNLGMKPMKLVRYLPEHLEPMLVLHRSARLGLEKLGLDIGISERNGEADLRSIEQAYFQSGGEFLIGLLDGVVIAMGGFQRTSSDSAELRRMRIRTDLQDQGYGSQLLQELEKAAFQRGIHRLSFQTAKARPLTLEFYLKHGYQETGTGFYGNVETVRFAKSLGRKRESAANKDTASSMNPWLSISAADYEGHMDAPNVGQLSVLNGIFRDALRCIPSKTIAVLGCGTGNGFEHIDREMTKRVVGIDINSEYLSLLKERHASRLPELELVCSDVSAFSPPNSSFDLIYGALIFEYVDYARMLKRISDWLTPKGTLVCVFQLPSPESGVVSETEYSSLKSLESIMRLVDPHDFDARARECGLTRVKQSEIPLKQGKRFLVSYYGKTQGS